MRSLSAIALAWLLVSLAAQEPAPVSLTPRVRPAKDAAESIIDRRPNLRVDTTVVTVPVVVTQAGTGLLVTRLEIRIFKLTEEKVELDVPIFASEDAPLSVGGV